MKNIGESSVEAKVNMDVVRSKKVSVKRQCQERFSVGIEPDNNTGRLHGTMRNLTVTGETQDEREKKTTSTSWIEETKATIGKRQTEDGEGQSQKGQREDRRNGGSCQTLVSIWPAEYTYVEWPMSGRDLSL